MPGGILRSKLNFVDLAGSERWSAHVEMSNVRVNEMTSINQSLSTLITVVACLTEEGRSHIPYRQARLCCCLVSAVSGCSACYLRPCPMCIPGAMRAPSAAA